MTEPHNLDRRRLIVLGAGLGAASLAAPALAQPAGRKIGYAIVGLGTYGAKVIMPRFKDCEHSRLTALVSGSPEKARTLAAEYGVPARSIYSYENFDRIADNPDVDVVYVCLPNSMHLEYTVRAARAGKHVMCEKPMATTVAEAEQMIEACRRANRKLMIGYRSRFQAHNIEAIRLARSGAIGKLRLVESDHGFPFGDPNAWRLKRALAGGGSLMDIGIYSVNAMRYLTGEEPVEVTATESTDRSDPRFREVEDTLTFQFRFPSGVLGTGISSYSSGHNRARVIGDQGFIDLEPATPYSGHQMRVGKAYSVPAVREVTETKNQFAGQLDHMAECILSNREPLTNGEEGLKDMRVIEAIYRAARTSGTVRLA